MVMWAEFPHGVPVDVATVGVDAEGEVIAEVGVDGGGVIIVRAGDGLLVLPSRFA
jgi:hypothetical protein